MTTRPCFQLKPRSTRSTKPPLWALSSCPWKFPIWIYLPTTSFSTTFKVFFFQFSIYLHSFKTTILTSYYRRQLLNALVSNVELSEKNFLDLKFSIIDPLFLLRSKRSHEVTFFSQSSNGNVSNRNTGSYKLFKAGLSYFTVKNDFYNLTCKLRIFTCKIVKNVLKSAVQLPKQK